MQLPDTFLPGLKATFLARLLRIAASGILIVLLARFLLTPQEYGLLFLAISVLGITQFFSDLGLSKAGARYVTEFRETDSSQVPHILEKTLKYRLTLIVLVGTCLVLTSDWIASLVGEPDLAPLLVVGVGYIASHSLQTFNATIFQGFNRVTWSAVVVTIEQVGRLVFVVAFVVAGLGAVGALAGYVVSGAIAAAVGLAVLYRQFYCTYERAETVDAGLPRRILEYSVPLTFTRSASIIDRKVDTVLVGFFLNPVAVAFYTLGKQISQFLTVPAGSLGFTISPTYGEQKADGRLDEAARIYETTLRYVLLLYVPAAVGVFLVAEPMIEFVFGAEYAGAVPVVQVFSVFVLFSAIISVTTDALDYLGRARERAIAKGTTSLANLALNVVLIPRIGVVGAALATVVTFGAYTLLNLYVIYRELPLATDDLLRTLGVTALISVAMAAPVLTLTPYISGLPTLFGVVLLGVAIWGMFAIASGLLDVRRVVSLIS